MTSFNAVVIVIRLVISFFIMRFLAVTLGEAGIAKIGSLRNVVQILTSTSSLGTFNGIVKYVSENEQDQNRISKLFSAVFIFGVIGSVLSGAILFFSATYLSVNLFGDDSYVTLIRCLAFLPPIIGLNRIFYGVINGLSDYKKYAKIELVSYLFSAALLLIFLYSFSLKGVLFSIILTPILSFAVILMFFYKRLRSYIHLNELSFDLSFAKPLLAFTLMSFISSVLINYIELDIRTTITNRINISEAGYWTAINYLSKNYMVFSSSIFTLYVIPKFAKIHTGVAFKKEVFHIYKTILPLFGLGMLLVYLFRNVIIQLVFPGFDGLEPLFKWQLLGDFVRLATLVISYQFLAKKMVWSFVVTELISLGLFYGLSKYLVDIYGAEGVVMAHFYRYAIYFFIVIFAVWNYFKNQDKKQKDA
ncbi:O-antigen translocase [Subsaximicrobium wynnwilliamsii]|uniref:O-antigen translocase n=2 Tax=Subsaximicrobium wynnwilliamsii TaxID=291179 RepID=A0A5C6ZIL7_9FLAO|nr:O-antigen translocase [Subsaximicrobium wynnwilliamsii]TXD89161.1 O-antigen translocase [Subsaximicrobium wynnwilliamsii]TXE03417.1 O-antigen translocase [Subsaximicrobium wynnwilliamsii]